MNWRVVENFGQFPGKRAGGKLARGYESRPSQATNGAWLRALLAGQTRRLSLHGFCRWHLEPILAIEAAENQSYNQQRDGAQDARFGTDYPSCEPARATKRRTQHVVVGHDTAVGNSVESLTPVPGEVKADGSPEAAGPAQEEAKEKPVQPRGDGAHGGLVGIEVVTETEQERHHERRRPEADSGSERVLQVSAAQELFKQSGHEEGYAPRRHRGGNRDAVESQAGNVESAQHEHGKQRAADRQKARQESERQILTQGLTQGQTVVAEFAMLDSSHDPGSCAQQQKNYSFNSEHQERGDRNFSSMLLTSRKPWTPPLRMSWKQPMRKTTSTTKRSKRQPARGPLGPTKIVFQPDAGSRGL